MNEKPREPRLPLYISMDDPAPMYAQVESQLRDLILDGHLKPETRLPSIRALARDHHLQRDHHKESLRGPRARGLRPHQIGQGYSRRGDHRGEGGAADAAHAVSQWVCLRPVARQTHPTGEI